MANNVGDPQDSGTLYPVTTQKVSGAVNNSISVTLTASNTGIAVGQVVTGPGVPNADGINPATTVSAISSTSLTLSRPANLVENTILNFAGTTGANIATDFVWGNFPIQANDDRATVAAANLPVTGVLTPTLTAATTTDGTNITFTTSAAHGLVIGSVVNTGLAAVGGTVAVPTAGTTHGKNVASVSNTTVTADTTQLTATLTTGAAHYVAPGATVVIAGVYPAAYNGTFVAQSGTTGTTLKIAGVGANGSLVSSAGNTTAVSLAAVANTAGTVNFSATSTANLQVGAVLTKSSGTGAFNGTTTVVSVNTTNNTFVVDVIPTTDFTAAVVTTAGTVTTYPYDLSNAVVSSVPSTTTFKVTNPNGWSGSAALTATAGGSLELIGDASWGLTIKKQSDRLTASLDGHNIVEGAYYGFPSFNSGLYKVTAATADGTRVWYTAPNNLKVNDVVSITGLTDGATAGTSTLNLANQTVIAATADNFLVTNAATAKTLTGQNGSAAIRYFDDGNYQVTAASGNGTTVTYTSQNSLIPGATVSITGLNTSAFNLSAQTVATANAVSFTVTNSAGNGVSITGQTGKVSNDTAASIVDGAFVAGTAALNGINYQTSTPYVQVPNVVGLTTANALDGLLDRGLVATSVGTTSSSAKSITAVTRTAGSTLAVCTLTTHGLLEGHVVTASSSSLAGITNTVQYRVLYKVDANNFVINTSASTVLTSGTVTLTPVIGTVYSQSIAAGAATTASGTAVTVNNWN